MSMPAELVSPDMNLQSLLLGLADAPPVAINGVATDSRLLQHGFVFLACEGRASHGIDYVAEAIASGAAAVVYLFVFRDGGTKTQAGGTVGATGDATVKGL